MLLGVGLLAVLLGALALTASPAVADPIADPTPAPAAGAPPATPDRQPPPDPSSQPENPATPGLTPAPTPPPTGSSEDPSWWDIPGQIRQAIGDFLLWVARTGLRPVFDTLGATVLATPDLTGNDQVHSAWTTTLLVANAVFVLFVIAGAFIVASRESLQSQYGLKQILPRLVIAAMAANLSLIVVGHAIEAANAVTAAIAGQGVDGPTAAAAFVAMLDPALNLDLPVVLLALLVLAVIVLAIAVVITFVLRVALLILLIAVAPLALLCHATPQTEGLAYAWWRALAGCMAWQLGQAIIVLVTVRVLLTPTGLALLGARDNGLLGILVCLTMLWLLVKLPGWMRHLILGSLDRRRGGIVGMLVHAYFTIKTLGAVAGLTGGRRSAHSRRSAPPPAPPTARTPPLRPTPPPRPAPPGPRPPAHAPTPARPAPPGPAGFSHPPATQPPAYEVAGSTDPAFSHPNPPATPRTASAAVPPPRFSHSPGRHTAVRASDPAVPVRFSSTPGAAASRAGGPAQAVVFSAAQPRHSAPRRTPAPAAPAFSAPPPPASPAPARMTRPPVGRPTASPPASAPMARARREKE